MAVKRYNGSGWDTVAGVGAQGAAGASGTAPLTTKGDILTYDTAANRLAVGNNGETLVADSSTATGLRYQVPVNSNPVLNSAMQVWQRGTSVSVPSSASTYTADRWALYRGATGMTVSRQTTSDTTNLPFIQYCARIQRNAGDTSTVVPYFSQSFETINSIPYAGKTMTLSFYVRKGANFSSATGISVNVVTGTGTDQSWLGYTGTVFALNQDNQAITTTWQRLTYTFSIGATATELTPIFSYNPSGTAGANDYFEVTGVQLEIGSVATPFKTYAGTIQGELAACQRYYFRTPIGTAGSVIGQGFIYNSTSCYPQTQFPVIMRTSPTSLDYSEIRIEDAVGTSHTITAATINVPNAFGSRLVGTISGATQGRFCQLQPSTSNGYVGYSAEL